MYDTYLHGKLKENTHYEFITEELWTWLKERYGTDHEIRRLYQK